MVCQGRIRRMKIIEHYEQDCKPTGRLSGRWRSIVLFGTGVILIAGCQQNPFLVRDPQAANHVGTGAAKIQELERRIAELDTTNRQINAQLAQVLQKNRLNQDQTVLLQTRLKETAAQLQKVQFAKKAAEEKVSSFQASMRQRGSAILTPNNSLNRSIEPIDIPGLTVRQDGDLVRIEIPADRLFGQGTSQVLASGSEILAQAAQAIAAHYPRQRIAIEVHADSGPNFDSAAAHTHLLTAQQAVAVLDDFTRRFRLPAKQLFILAMGSNHPRASNATAAGRAANRRVEIVIYPETF